MEITVTDVPRCIKSFAFSPRIILSEKNTVDYLIRMKEYIFGSRCCEAAEKLGIDIFDLVFINEKTFDESIKLYLNKLRERDKEIVKIAFLLKKMYNGEYVRISKVMCESEKAYVREPEFAYLNILNDSSVDTASAKKNNEKREKKSKKKQDLSKYSQTVMESIRLAAVKYGMKSSLNYKELIDLYNYRRFSTNLRLNNRPAKIEEIEAVLREEKDKCLADLSNTKLRIYFSVLFSIAYGDFGLRDLYDKNTVFDNSSFDKEKRLSDLACDLINIVHNGNGIEVANMFIKMITAFAETEMPEVNMKDLAGIMDNYALYYATATLAKVCENIFKFEGLGGELKQYIKKHTFDNYWNTMDRLLLMSQYSVVVSFCYKLANFDVVGYREDPEYQGEILYSFERAEKFSKELKKNAKQ